MLLKSASLIFAILIASSLAEEEVVEKPRGARNILPWRHPHNYNYFPPYYHNFNQPNAPFHRPSQEFNSPILYSNDVRQPDGSYNYEFETANGIRRSENSVQTVDDNVVQGSYSYVGPDGQTYTVNYVADRNGFRAFGNHLPVQQTSQPIAPIIGKPGAVIPANHLPAPIPVTPIPPVNVIKKPFGHYPIAPFPVYSSPWNPYSTVRPFIGHPYNPFFIPNKK